MTKPREILRVCVCVSLFVRETYLSRVEQQDKCHDMQEGPNLKTDWHLDIQCISTSWEILCSIVPKITTGTNLILVILPNELANF